MDKPQNKEMGQNLPFARVVAGKDFTRYDANTNGAGTVACTEYFCRGRTFRVALFLTQDAANWLGPRVG